MPNAPNFLRYDTEVFFVFALLQYFTITAQRILCFLIATSLLLFEYIYSYQFYVSINELIPLVIFFIMIFFVKVDSQLVKFIESTMNSTIILILILTLLRIFLDLDILFSDRPTSFERSFPFTYPEASYAAKNFFGFFIFLFLATRKTNIYLIALMFFTFSVTGIFLGILSLLISVGFSLSARNKIIFFFLGIISFLILRLFFYDSIIESTLIPGRAKYIFEILLNFDFASLIYFLSEDVSFNSRLLSFDEFDIRSLFGYAATFFLTFIFLGFIYVFTLYYNKASFGEILIKIVAILIFGYADSFVYPAFILAILVFWSSSNEEYFEKTKSV